MDKEHVGMNVLTTTDSPFQFLTLLLERHKAKPIGMNDTVETVQWSTTPHALIVEGRTGVQVIGDADRLGQVFF